MVETLSRRLGCALWSRVVADLGLQPTPSPKPNQHRWVLGLVVEEVVVVVRNATDDHPHQARNFPSCSLVTFSAPCAVAVGKETWIDI
jgi:hypothetical protein